MELYQNLKFKTNINCSGCIRAVTPHLYKAEGIEAWKVDTDNADKILTVESSGITEDEVMEVIKKAGYKIEPIHE